MFIQVGNGKFEALVKHIDSLKAQSKIKDKVLIQLGHGKYIPKHCEYFRFKSPLTPFQKKADIIISHGGPGCVFETLLMGKKMIAIPNTNRTDPRHQVEYLEAMAKETTSLIYCPKIKDLEKAITKAKSYKPPKYRKPECQMHNAIQNLLG